MVGNSSSDALAQARSTHVRVGIGGWTFAAWRENFYPPQLQQRRELEFASRHVTAIEINGTYYGAQKPATYAKWRMETPDGFTFSLKAPRYATNRKTLADAGKTIDAFVFGGLAELGDRLGPILWQLPETKPFESSDIAAFFDLLPRSLDGCPMRHVIEVRHPSFKTDDYVELARQHRIPTVFTDSEEYPSFADTTGDFVYARLMRSQADIASGYPAKELKAWAKRAHTWAQGKDPEDLPRVSAKTKKPVKSRDVYVYFISGAKERNPAAAMGLIGRL